MTYDVMIYDIILYDAISYDVIIYEVMTYDNMTYDIMTYDVITYDVMTYGGGHSYPQNLEALSLRAPNKLVPCAHIFLCVYLNLDMSSF